MDKPVGVGDVGTELDEEHKTLTVTYRFSTSSCQHKVDAIDFGLSGIVIPIQDGEEGVTQVLNAKAIVSDNGCEVKHEEEEAVCTYELENHPGGG